MTKALNKALHAMPKLRTARVQHCVPAMAASLLALLLTGCGEYKQVVPYEDGQYQGKTDQRHWDNERFSHDRSAWAEAVNQRAQRQNEYNRSRD